MKKFLIASLLSVFLCLPAFPQAVTRVCTELIGANGSNNCTEVSVGNPFPVTGGLSSLGTTNINTGQVSVGTSPTLIAAARPGGAGTGRAYITITNTGASTIYIGGSAVTTSTGFPVGTNGTISLQSQAAIYAIVATGSDAVAFLETY